MRRLILSIILALIFFSMLNSRPDVRSVEISSKTYTVGPPGSGADFTKIQDAINAASSGDTIAIWNWLYEENVVVNKSVTIIGTNSNATIVSAFLPNENAFSVGASNVTLTGLRIEGANGASGIYVSKAYFSNISGNVVQDNKFGVSLDHSDSNLIRDNTITAGNIYPDAQFGVSLDHSDSNLIRDNTIAWYTRGINVENSTDNRVLENNVTGNSGGIFVLDLLSRGNLIQGNTVSSSTGSIYWYTETGIGCQLTSGNTISENVVENTGIGIFIYDAVNHTIIGNKITGSRSDGIRDSGTSGLGNHNIIVGNTIADGYQGILVAGVDFDIIQYNNVTSTEDWGIRVDAGDNTEVLSNYASNNGGGWGTSGIYVTATNNTIYNNTVVSNGNNGVMFEGNANSVIDNYVSLNDGEGISFSGSACTISNNVATFNGGGIGTDGHNNRILENDIEGNGYGIYLKETNAKNNEITGNKIANNNNGLMILGAMNVVLENNIIGNVVGVQVSSGQNNTMSANDLAENNIGVWLTNSAAHNEISSNIIVKNLFYGVCINQSSNVNYMYNNIFNNTANAYDDGYNYWNLYPKAAKVNILGGPFQGGNFWSDYTGVDTDMDGIGDTEIPYNSTGNINNQGDRLPLVPSVSFTYLGDIVDVEGQHHPVLAATNSTIIPGGFASDRNTFRFNMTTDGNTGYLCIMIQNGLSGLSALIYVNNYQVDYTANDNGTHYFLYLTVPQGSDAISVAVIPEFSVWSMLPIFIMATLLAVEIYRKKHAHT